MMRAFLIMLVTTTAFGLGGCGRSEPEPVSESIAEAPPLTAASLGEQTILSARDYLVKDKYASADVSRGEALSMQCRACHTLEQGGAIVLGPNLFGVFGRIAGSAADYPYSEELATADFVWTPRALDAWLAQPFAFLPGNRMSFPGLKDGNDRNAVIAYLLHHTADRADEST